MSRYIWHVNCACGRKTTPAYARTHGGQCKACAEPLHYARAQGKRDHARGMADERNARIIDSGYNAYAQEEGHDDIPDNS